jgi:hypothetical protein
MAERIQQSTPGTLSQQWYEDGVIADPGTVTIGITRADGTVLVAAGTATSGTTTAPRTFNLTTTHTATLDTFKATWTSPTKGTLISYVEVVGGFLFTLAQAKALLPTATIPDLSDARTYAETELEGALGYALVPRYTLEKRTGQFCQTLRVRNPYIRAIRSASVNGTALSSPQLTALSFDTSGFVDGYLWGANWGMLSNVTIGYEHGLDTPPPGATTAALSLAVDYLGGGSGSIDPRAESIITVDGTVRLRASAGQFAAVGVNEWVAANRMVPVA